MEEIKQTDEERIMLSQMEKMVNTYDSYMKKVCMGREVNFAA